eukprot:scaffold17088_cov17-Tisochrysis_lutea.AAC.5
MLLHALSQLADGMLALMPASCPALTLRVPCAQARQVCLSVRCPFASPDVLVLAADSLFSPKTARRRPVPEREGPHRVDECRRTITGAHFKKPLPVPRQDALGTHSTVSRVQTHLDTITHQSRKSGAFHLPCPTAIPRKGKIGLE